MYIFDSRFDEFNLVRNLETLRSISSRRIADTRNFMEFLSLQSVIRMKIKKELDGGRDSKRTGARDDGAWQKRSRGEIWPAGRRGQGEKQFDSHNIQPAHRWSVQSCPDSGYIVLACWPDLAKYIALSGRGQLRL